MIQGYGFGSGSVKPLTRDLAGQFKGLSVSVASSRDRVENYLIDSFCQR